MITEIQLNNKRFMKAQKREARRKNRFHNETVKVVKPQVTITHLPAFQQVPQQKPTLVQRVKNLFGRIF